MRAPSRCIGDAASGWYRSGLRQGVAGTSRFGAGDRVAVVPLLAMMTVPVEDEECGVVRQHRSHRRQDVVRQPSGRLAWVQRPGFGDLGYRIESGRLRSSMPSVTKTKRSPGCNRSGSTGQIGPLWVALLLPAPAVRVRSAVRQERAAIVPRPTRRRRPGFS